MPEEQVFTEKERTALTQFKKRVEGLDVKNKDLLEDRRLINWLRARDCRLDDAENMFRKHLAWRQENDIETILTSNNLPDELLNLVPVELMGPDKEGNPTMVLFTGGFEIKKHVQTYGKATIMKVYSIFMERLYADCILHSTDKRKLNKFVNIIDLEALRYKDCLSADVLDVLTNAMKCVEANYPELLEKAYVLNAPAIFPIIWNLIKPFLSQKTISNVHFFNSNLESYRSVLLERLPVNKLPRRWGGSRYCELWQLNVYSASVHITDEFRKNFEEKTIPAGEALDLSFEVETPKTLLSWSFKTENYDIGFSVVHKQLSSDCEEKEIIEYKRYNVQKILQTGSMVCETKGQFILRFDNTYSKFRGKTVMYHVELSQLTADDGSCKEVQVGNNNARNGNL
ncbi:unnamed protein product [Orchesella dallaii]|uniref:SEC14-like protein 2 n=1 Tax=Orchesella dallaii TaxID=48710 RepID=A0ABP1RCJ9_9HEXA